MVVLLIYACSLVILYPSYRRTYPIPVSLSVALLGCRYHLPMMPYTRSSRWTLTHPRPFSRRCWAIWSF